MQGESEHSQSKLLVITAVIPGTQFQKPEQFSPSSNTNRVVL